VRDSLSQDEGKLLMSPSATELSLAIEEKASLSSDDLRKINAYWCACNYLALGRLQCDRAPDYRESSESGSDEWINNEVIGCKFQDVRHGKRLRQLLDQLSGNVGATTPRACRRPVAKRFLEIGYKEHQATSRLIDQDFGQGLLAALDEF
jgi:hypothetical protein